MNHHIVIALALVPLASCSTHDMMLRPLKPAIIDAASDSRSAGAEKLEMEFSVVYANTAELTAPVPFVPVKLGGSRDETTSVKVSIEDLKKWKPEQSDSAVPDGLYKFDATTKRAVPVLR